MDIFSNLMFYSFMNCRKSQLLRGLDNQYPKYLLFSQIYETPSEIYEQVMVQGRSGWGYPWKIDLIPEIGIELIERNYSNFKSAQQDIKKWLERGIEVYIWTRNKFIPHMVSTGSDLDGTHSLTLTKYDLESFMIMDYPFERQYSYDTIARAFDDVPVEKRIVTTCKLKNIKIPIEMVRSLEEGFRLHILTQQGNYDCYDKLILDMEQMNIVNFLNRSLQFFGVIALSRILTVIFLENTGYSEQIIQTARQAAKIAENMKNRLYKIGLQPSRFSAIELAPKFQLARQIECDFLEQLQYEIRKGEPLKQASIITQPPERLRALSITDSSIFIVWEDSMSDINLMEYEITVNGKLIGRTISRKYIIGCLSPSTKYTIRVRAKHPFASWGDESRLTVTTSPVQQYGNLSTYRLTVASSEENEDLCAINAVDNDSSTRWSSKYSDKQWIYVDLGSIKDVNRVRIKWEGAYAQQYEVLHSQDFINWKLIQQIPNGQPGLIELDNSSVKTRYIKIIGLKRGTVYGYSLWEFAVFNDEASIS